MSGLDRIIDLRERRAAYAGLLQAIRFGKLLSDDPKGDAARIDDLQRRIVELDALISSQDELRAPGT